MISVSRLRYPSSKPWRKPVTRWRYQQCKDGFVIQDVSFQGVLLMTTLPAIGVHGQRRNQLSNEIRATLVDHVINHGLTMHEAGQRVQPNLSRFTVASVIRTFRLEHRTERLNHGGGRGRLFTGEQETAIVNLVLANNEIRLREIQSHIIQNNTTFNNIQQVGPSTLARILKQNHIRLKQLYKVPFERNSQRNKDLRRAYVDGVLEMDAHAIPHEYIFIDEAGFNLAKTRRRGRNIIGHRARNRYVVVWDNVSFHRAAPVQNWFADHPPFLVQYLPPYSPFLNPIEEFFSAWRWKVYDRQPHVRIPLMQGMEEACDEIAVGAIQGWIRHSRRFFPRCLARENIACDVDEALWPDPAVRQDAA
ncbi:hypothetical protein N1851_007823 [Merluccius polli]|uniref:Tc1-like transposase DDE domain-containing protein n=1 Tax=Merluccius polli TaxID=89951 RepID=A0AA47N3L9_MERPO|nr:hypothetical protein N1851_007823 [Merluccius polli]